MYNSRSGIHVLYSSSNTCVTESYCITKKRVSKNLYSPEVDTTPGSFTSIIDSLDPDQHYLLQHRTVHSELFCRTVTTHTMHALIFYCTLHVTQPPSRGLHMHTLSLWHCTTTVTVNVTLFIKVSNHTLSQLLVVVF